MAINQVVLGSLPNTVPFEELSKVAVSVQRQLSEHLPAGWGFSATIHAIPNLAESPPGAGQIIVVNDIKSAPGTFGFHLVNPNGPGDDDDQPFALVEYSANGLWSIDVSHECLEMLINPFGNTMFRSQSLEGNRLVDYLLEVCDPCGRAPLILMRLACFSRTSSLKPTSEQWARLARSPRETSCQDHAFSSPAVISHGQRCRTPASWAPAHGGGGLWACPTK